MEQFDASTEDVRIGKLDKGSALIQAQVDVEKFSAKGLFDLSTVAEAVVYKNSHYSIAGVDPYTKEEMRKTKF